MICFVKSSQLFKFQDHSHYSFSYGVSDPLTGDSKRQEEVRDGDVVKGSYSVKDPDGTIRVVQYSQVGADSGINAVVKRIGEASHPQNYKTASVTAPVAGAADAKSHIAVNLLG